MLRSPSLSLNRLVSSGRLSGVRSMTTTGSKITHHHHPAPTASTIALLVGTSVVAGSIWMASENNDTYDSYFPYLKTQPTLLDARVPIGGELITTGTPIKETATGILFPQLCNGFYLAGCGVRAKWGLIKVYAVGTYLDPLAMSAIKKSNNPEALQKALLDPTYPRTIRIVMARGLSVDKFTSAIIEAVEPRMKGQDLEKLDEFKALMPPVDLIKGAEMEMTIRGETLLFKNATGGIGTIHSRAFTEAMCDVYYGEEAVSPSHKEAVLAGIPKL